MRISRMAAGILYILLWCLLINGAILSEITTKSVDVNNLKSQQSDDKIRDLELQICQQNNLISDQNVKFAEMETLISDQNNQISDQDVKFAKMETLISDKNVKFAKMETLLSDQNVKFAKMETLISDKNVKFAKMETLISDQNTHITEMKLFISELKMKMEKQQNQNPDDKSVRYTDSNITTGSVFTRWGRRDCPQLISQLVYSGITGGSHFTDTGGAAEYVCLPPDPIWNTNKHYNGKEWGYMYGSSYQSLPKPITRHRVPCAVCRTKQYSTVLMIPARTQCYPGWQEAYHGELVSGRHDHKAASQYVCLDDSPQNNGSVGSGKYMYPVRAKCGALPCPHYEHDTLLTCVVCLK